MISLEQVRALESRVEKAVTLITTLRSENESLRSGLAAAESRVAELEGLVADFQKDQARIEEGIIEALRKLDAFEDTVHLAVSSQKPAEAAPVNERQASRVTESAHTVTADATDETIADAIAAESSPVDPISSDDGSDALYIF